MTEASNRPEDQAPGTGGRAVDTGGGLGPTIPISRQRIRGCLESAGFWVSELPRYADREQRASDWLAIIAATLGALTGLAIWPALNEASDLTVGKLIFSAGAIATALIAALPKIMNFAEMAGQARELASRYGSVLGDLEDLDADAQDGTFDQQAALAVVTEFEATKQKKDALRRLPDRQAVEARRRGLARTD